MSDKITVALELVGGGSIKVAAKNAEELNEGLNKVVNTIQKADKAFATLENRKPKVAAAAMERSGPSAAELTNYNAQRGAAGAAGGTARDFAAQAQGLGGLVRLYATFAANIFAVTTAYNALQNAFKTEKMIQAAERFSGTVGTSMRSVAKSLQEVTQYSLSFQDAVKFANVGTAAGLAAKDIQNLTVIAKGAATALGRDVGESIQRIIQGTAKQEQEILDELGIFIKSKKAFEDYAKARNMKADDLTATQRTLAYAEAVAKAGEKWKEFADIDDPFGKLNASLQNALTETLNTVNKIITPIVKLFADSSEAIIALGALVTSALLKRALPELKDAMLGAITFDRSRAKAAADLLRVNIGSELTQVKAEAAALTKQLDEATKSLTNLGSAKARTNFATSLIPQDMAQTGSGKNINYGISASQLSKEIFKEEDLARFKSVADINKAVEASLASQVKHAADKSKVIEALISKGIVEQGSNEKNLILSQKTISNNASILAAVQKRAAEEALIVNAHEKQETLLARQAVLEKELAAVGGQKASRITASDILSASRAAASAAPQITSAAEVAKNSAEQVAKATLVTTSNVVTGARAMKDSFNNVGEALEKGRVAASAEGLGIVSNAKLAGSTLAAMGATLATLPGQFLAASGAAAKFGVAGAAAGTLAATGFSLLRQALSGVMAALGPIMLAWTVWELAGDKIREFFNANIAYEKVAKEAKQASEDYLKVIVDLEKAFTRSNIVLRDSNSSLTEISKAYEVQANAIRSLTTAYEAYTAKLREAEALKNAPEVAKKAGVKFDEEELKLLVESQTRLRGLNELISSGKNLGVSTDSLEAQKASLEGYIAQLDNLDKQMANGFTKANMVSEIFKNMKNVFLDSSDSVAMFRKEFELASSKMSATTATIEAGFNKVGSALDTDVINKLKATQAGFKDVSAYKEFASFEKLKKDIREADAAISASNIFSEKGIALDNLKKVVDANNALGQKYKELVPLEAALLKLQTARAALQNAVSFGAAQAAAEQIEAAQTELNNLLQSNSFGAGYKKLLEGLKSSTEQYSNDAKGRFKSIELAIKAAENALKALNAALEVSSKLANFRSSFTGQANLEVNQAQKRRDIIQQEYEIELKKAQLARDKVLESRNLPEKDKENARKEFDLSVASLNQTREQKLILDDLNVIELNRNETLRLIEERYKQANEAADRSLGTAKGQLELEKAYSEIKATSLNLTSEQSRYESLLAEQQLKRLENAAKEQALQREAQKLRDEINAKANAESKATKAASTDYADKNDRLIIEGKLAEIDKARAEALNKVNAESQKKLDALDEEKTRLEELLGIENRRAKLLATQSSAAQKMAKFTSSLVGAFKNTGMEKQATAVANVLKVTQTYQQKLERFDQDNVTRKKKNIDKLTDLEIQAANGIEGAALEVHNLRKQIDAEDTKSIENRKELELETVTEGLNAFKDMFSEKTAAYKVLDGIERAMHAYKMTMMAIEMAAQLKKLAVTMTSATAETAAQAAPVAAGAAKDTPGPWPVKLAAAVAALAFIRSLAGGGGGGAAPTAGMSAKDRQETQGTGMSWVNGQKVENGNGVFGDSSAKSESIKNSLEIIADNTIEGLSYDVKMLKALENIDKAIGSSAKSLYGVQGITTGSGFGNPNVSVSNSGIRGLFGSSTTREIVDSGIKIAGMFSELARGLGSYTQYETTQQTRRKSGFLGIGGSTSISYSTDTKNLDASVKESLAQIFSNASDLFKEVGSRVGITIDEITSKLSGFNVNFEASLKGLTGEELEEALNATISQALDGATKSLFGAQFTKYQKFGEGLLETAIRVVDTNEKLKVALGSLGVSLGTFTLDASEALVELSGGLEEFTSQVNFYRDNFLTDSEKLAQAQANVTKVMSDLRYGSVDTREEFKTLVASLDLNSVSGRELYSELMKIAPAFAEVTEAHQNLIEDYRNLENEFLSVFSRSSSAKAALLAREEEGLSEVAKQQLQRNRALEQEIKTLEEANSLIDELDQYVLSSSEARAKERASISESNRGLFDLIKAYEDRGKAEEDMASAMSNITSAMENFRSVAEEAAGRLRNAAQAFLDGYNSAVAGLDSAKSALVQAKNSLLDLYYGAVNAAKAADAAVQTALANITKAYVAAQANLNSELAKITQGYINAQERLKSALNGITSGFINASNAVNSARDSFNQAKNALIDLYYGAVNAAQTASAAVQTALNNISAAYVAAQNSLNSERSKITQGYVASQGKLKNALSNITSGFVSAQKELESAQNAIAAQERSNRKQVADNLRNISKSINEFINSLYTGQLSVLSDGAKFSVLQSKFDDLFTKALAGDPKAGEKLQSVAAELLEAGKSQFSTSEQYAALYANVLDKLTRVTKDFADKAGPEDVNDSMSNLLADLAAAQANFAKWQDAVNESGAATILAEEDLLAEWKDAAKELTKWEEAVTASGASKVEAELNLLEGYNKALEEFTAASDALNASGASTTVVAENLLEEYLKATEAQVKANTDLATVTDLVTRVLGSVPQTQATNDDIVSKLNKATEEFTNASAALTSAEQTLAKWQEAVNQSGASTTQAEENFLAEWQRAVAEVAKWDEAVTASGASRVASETDLLDGYNKALQEFNTVSAAVIATGASTVVSSQNILDEYTKAVEAQVKANEDLASITTVITELFGEVPDSQSSVNSLTEKLAKATEEYTKATTALVNAEASMLDWKNALIDSGMSLDEIKDLSQTSSNTAADMLAELRDAKTAKEKADKDLLEATELTSSLIPSTTSAIEDLKKSIEDYNKAKDLYDSSSQFIRDTKLDNIISSINSSAESIVAAIIAQATPPVSDDPRPYNPPIRNDILPQPGDPDFVGPIRNIPSTGGIQPTVPGFPYSRDDFDYSGEYNYWRNVWAASGGTISPSLLSTNIGIPAFASGGMHTGGLRLVGENGAELEATGPSRIFNASQTQDILGGASLGQAQLLKDVIGEVSNLKEAVEKLISVANKTEQHVKKSKDILETVTQGGDTLKTEVA